VVCLLLLCGGPHPAAPAHWPRDRHRCRAEGVSHHGRRRGSGEPVALPESGTVSGLATAHKRLAAPPEGQQAPRESPESAGEKASEGAAAAAGLPPQGGPGGGAPV